MVLVPRFKMGPPSRSFAADAHDCIMVATRPGRPNTKFVARDLCAHDGELPSVSSQLLTRSRKSAAVLAAVKGKSLRDGLRPPLTAAPRSSLAKTRSGREMSQPGRTRRWPITKGLDTNRPIHVQALVPYKSKTTVRRRSYGIAARDRVPTRSGTQTTRSRQHRSAH